MTDLCDMQPFFEAMHRALKPGGMVCTQVSFPLHTLPAFPGHGCCLCTAAAEAACTILHQLGTPPHCVCAALDKNDVMKKHGMPDVPGIFMCTGCLQGESLWLHLDIIKSLAAMCHEVFVGGTVQYAYTTIPTYPRWGLQTQARASVGCWPLLAAQALTHAPCVALPPCTAEIDMEMFAWLCSGQIGFMVCAKQTSKDFKMNVARRTPPSDSPAGYPPLR